MTDLGTLGGKSSIAGGVNRSGQVVGSSQTKSGRWHTFLWSRGRMIDLGTLGARDGSANGVNASGDIVGAIQWDANGQHPHAVLWTKTKRAGHTRAPSLKGMTLPSAHDAIARAECSFGRLRRAYSGRVERARVISQSPRAGTRVLWGTKIDLVISRGRRG
jgi:probable HAF family extracellular repeat protein